MWLERYFPSAVAIAVDRARRRLDEFSGLMARDALHAEVVLSRELDSICSFDRDFDLVRGLRLLNLAERVLMASARWPARPIGNRSQLTTRPTQNKA
jgi:hypothetical protein